MNQSFKGFKNFKRDTTCPQAPRTEIAGHHTNRYVGTDGSIIYDKEQKICKLIYRSEPQKTLTITKTNQHLPKSALRILGDNV